MKFDVILMDPPWPYYGDPNKMGAAGKEYPLMTLEAIQRLGIPKVLSSRGIVFMWTTSSQLENALKLCKGWNLHYRGVAFVWVKLTKDLRPMKASGVRPSITKPLTEFVVAASSVKKGRPLSLSSESIVQTVFAPRRRHSSKPHQVQARLEVMYPHASKLELFARESRPGWKAWGNEV